jgi:cadmium resistance protein CadD (predicted permease)
VHSIGAVILFASLAFIGTMFDNFFAFAAQLVITERARFRRVSWAQVLGIGALVVIAAGVGALLTPIPLRWIGLLCVAPFAFAYYAWRHRSSARGQFRRGAVTTFVLTLSLGGDNLAVWIPLLRSNGTAHAFVTVAVFAVWDGLFLFGAQRLASHPRVVAWGEKRAPALMPYVYVALGVLILLECRTF